VSGGGGGWVGEWVGVHGLKPLSAVQQGRGGEGGQCTTSATANHSLRVGGREGGREAQTVSQSVSQSLSGALSPLTHSLTHSLTLSRSEVRSFVRSFVRLLWSPKQR